MPALPSQPEPVGGDAVSGYQVGLAGVSEITVTVTSTDGLRTRVYRVRLGALGELALESGFNTIEWTGTDGIAVADALADVADTVAAVYAWDDEPRMWLAYFPGLDDVPGVNTLATLDQNRTYWIAVQEAITWTVLAP